MADSRVIKKRHNSYFFPTYFLLPDVSNHVKKLKSLSVKLIRVSSDVPPRLAVAFRDGHSLELLRRLEDALTKYYIESGNNVEKHLDNLKVGEIVAAKRMSQTVHRVQVKEITHIPGTGDIKVLTCGIDDGVQGFITKAWVLVGNFYSYPRQTSEAILLNIQDMYPKGVFEEFYKDENELKRVLKDVTLNVLSSLTSESANCIFLSEIQVAYDSGGHPSPVIAAKLNMHQNFLLRFHFLEVFQKYCIPMQPEMGATGYGVITDATRQGDFGLCPNETLIKLIDGYINSKEMLEKANNITEETRKDLALKASSGECGMFLISNPEKTRIYRAELKNVYGNNMKMFLLDAGRFVLIDTNLLVCPMVKNPDLPSLLLWIPSQALRFQMKGIKLISVSQCKDLCGTRATYNVVKFSGLFHVELLNAQGESINQMLLEKGAL